MEVIDLYIIFRLKINLKFNGKFINEQYKIFKFNIILKIYTFHLTAVALISDRFVNIFI